MVKKHYKILDVDLKPRFFCNQAVTPSKSKSKLTEIKKEVTCKNCLRELKRIRGLKVKHETSN